MIGQTISHYRIIDELGRGGMGIVYKAEDTKLDRTVALKFLPQHITKNDAEKERFLQEAKAAAALNHPHACAIYRIDEHEGQQFIEMEFVEGVTVREKVKGGGLPAEEAIRYGIQIGEALHEAHSKGIVHRDVKSENIMVSAKDQIKVMDFGLAKLKGSLRLTKSSSTVGTLGYMAPEQIQGGEVDARSDIFSLGVVLYEMLTGQMPFRGEHDASMMYSILNEEPSPVDRYVKDPDPEVTRIILRALEKEPEDRYQHVDDMVSELRRLKKQATGRVSRPTTPIPQTPSRSSPRFGPWMLGLIALAAITAGALWYFSGDAPPGIDSVAVLPFTNASGDPETDYLAEGMTETIINKLSQISGLRVIPRSMVGRFSGPDADPGEAGKALNVRTVLTGKVTQRGDELIVQAELIDVEKVSQLWGERYSRPLSDIIVVQQELAKAVVGKLETRLSGEDQQNLGRSLTSNPEAYQLYIKGRFYWNKRTAESSRTALTLFQQAVETDPAFAEAYVGMADCYFVGGTLDMKPNVAMPKAASALEKALAIDPNIAGAYAGLAVTEAYYRYDMNKGVEYLRRAIELDPAFPTAHHWLAELLVWQGKYEEGLREYERAMDLDPASLPILSDYGLALYFAGKPEEAIKELEKAIAMDPNFVRTHYYIVGSYLSLGLEDKAVDALLTGMEKDGADEEVLGEIRRAYQRDGFRGVGRVRAAWLERRAPGVVNAYTIWSAMWAGDIEKAVAQVRQAREERNAAIVTVRAHPAWGVLRADPRVAAILEEVGF